MEHLALLAERHSYDTAERAALLLRPALSTVHVCEASTHESSEGVKLNR